MNNKRLLKKVLIIFLILITFFLSIKILYGYTKSKNIKTDKNETKVETENKKTDNNEYTEVEGIKNVLLIGADYREGDKIGRSDSMIILTIDNVHKKVKLTSMLRDMLVNIEGHGKTKLNHAFAYGGPELTMNTIENNFGIKIDDYMIIDFNGFVSVIDKLGGVEVDVQKQDMNDLNKYVFDIKNENSVKITTPGVQRLNGNQALAYCRIRKNSGGEYRRSERQREVINSIIQEFKDTNILKYPSIISTGLNYIKTNMRLTELLNIAYTGSKLDLSNVETLRLPFDELSIGGIWKHYGWVFRTDLEVTGQILQDYLIEDKDIDISIIDKNNLNYNQ